MSKIDDIVRAIKSKKTISFEYNRGSKIHGVRIGNPHALYLFTSKKDGVQTAKLDIVQTEGVSDTPEKPFPKWMGPIFVDYIENVKVEDELPPFIVDSGYNPDCSPRYDFPIAKI
jgi:hypothetical protein